jgi:hypothetical protein
MRQLLQQLEEMHIRIAETATQEETLVKALGEALIRLDEQLLQDVHSIATEHEARRCAILGELQGLASSIGMFQLPRPTHAIEAEPTYVPIAGDWREATSNIRDDLEGPTNGHTAPRALFPHEQRRATAPLSLTERRRRAAG